MRRGARGVTRRRARRALRLRFIVYIGIVLIGGGVLSRLMCSGLGRIGRGMSGLFWVLGPLRCVGHGEAGEGVGSGGGEEGGVSCGGAALLGRRCQAVGL